MPSIATSPISEVEFDKLNAEAKNFVPLLRQDYEEINTKIGKIQEKIDSVNITDNSSAFGDTEEESKEQEEVFLDPENYELQYYNPCYENPLPDRYCPPLNREYTCIFVSDIPDEKMYQVIGGQGKVFKAISHQTGVDYIYWIKSQGLIAIWGMEDLLPYAVQRLHVRIRLVLNDFKM